MRLRESREESERVSGRVKATGKRERARENSCNTEPKIQGDNNTGLYEIMQVSRISAG